MEAVHRRELMIFVVGNSRSGTTMMGRILGAHPSVFTFGELHFFEQMWSPKDGERRLPEFEATELAARLLSVQRQGYLGRREPERFRDEARAMISSMSLEGATAARVFEAFLFHEAAASGGTIPCDQTPRNVFYIGDILGLYPEARVINMVRDPRDVLLSQKRKWKRRFLGARSIPLKEALRSRINYHPITISKLWNSSVSAADRFAGEDRVLSVRFEDLLADPEAEVRRVCEFAGLSFDGRLLEVPQVGSSSGRDRPEQRGIDTNKAGRWQNGGLSPTEVFLCQKVSGTPMKLHGYPRAPVSADPLRLVWSVATLPVKLALALLFNLNRMRNVREAINRRMS
jgi:omega-hydroxy-beta-dihydromenaquinone-9 sulfotransferase